MTYLQKINSRFIGVMQWQECDDIFAFLNANTNGWYIYDTTTVAPVSILKHDVFIATLSSIKQHITNNHEERYCGIVYVDNVAKPTMIKVFDPNNIGKSCGSSEHPPIAKWIISKLKPQEIEQPKKEKQGFISKFFK